MKLPHPPEETDNITQLPHPPYGAIQIKTLLDFWWRSGPKLRKKESEVGKMDQPRLQQTSECLSSSDGSCQSQIYPSNFFFLKRVKLTRKQLSAPLLQSTRVMKGDKTAAVLHASVLSSFILSSSLSFPLICPLSFFLLLFPLMLPLLSSPWIWSPFFISPFFLSAFTYHVIYGYST